VCRPTGFARGDHWRGSCQQTGSDEGEWRVVIKRWVVIIFLILPAGLAFLVTVILVLQVIFSIIAAD
jgi:hypothetical protein